MSTALTTNNLQALLAFPFRQPKGTEKLIVGAALTALSFVVPIVPGLFVTGYQAAVARRAIRTGELVLPEWTDWGTLLLDGLRVFGVGLIYGLPALLAIGLGYTGMMGTSLSAAFLEEAGAVEMARWTGVMLLGTFGGISLFGLGMLLGLAAFAIAPAALTHMLATDSFAAAFDYRAWGVILRANLGGYALAAVLIMGLSFAFSFALQILYFTIVLCCLVPLAMAAYSTYLGTVGGALFGLIYREGQQKAGAGSAAVSPAPPAPALPG